MSVESRLSKLSSDENVFIQATSVYQEASKRAGYNHKLSYNNSDKYNCLFWNFITGRAISASEYEVRFEGCKINLKYQKQRNI